jgi:glycosyltransferase involved in cell wall biosynthesis
MSISVVIPYYNEQEFLPATLASLKQQTLRPFTLILVNNGSTDASEGLARAVMNDATDIAVRFINEPQPGKLMALATGIAAVETAFVATCDADTYYPPHYLATCLRLFETGGPTVVGVMACDIYAPPARFLSRVQRFKIATVARLLPRQCHSGGYAQAFRTKALREAGGFSPVHWPYTLEDQEIVHRLLKRGKVVHSSKHWCMPSVRREDRSAVTWTLLERILYHLTPFALKDWLFYRFLARRFDARGMHYVKLRDKSWDQIKSA